MTLVKSCHRVELQCPWDPYSFLLPRCTVETSKNVTSRRNPLEVSIQGGFSLRRRRNTDYFRGETVPRRILSALFFLAFLYIYIYDKWRSLPRGRWSIRWWCGDTASHAVGYVIGVCLIRRRQPAYGHISSTLFGHARLLKLSVPSEIFWRVEPLRGKRREKNWFDRLLINWQKNPAHVHKVEKIYRKTRKEE